MLKKFALAVIILLTLSACEDDSAVETATANEVEQPSETFHDSVVRRTERRTTTTVAPTTTTLPQRSPGEAQYLAAVVAEGLLPTAEETARWTDLYGTGEEGLLKEGQDYCASLPGWIGATTSSYNVLVMVRDINNPSEPTARRIWLAAENLCPDQLPALQAAAAWVPTGFTDGIMVVGEDIQPGTYRTDDVSDFCYYARLKDFEDEVGSIISNNIVDSGPAVVTIKASDAGFESRGCGTWQLQ